jgi:hypothetical protein
MKHKLVPEARKSVTMDISTDVSYVIQQIRHRKGRVMSEGTFQKLENTEERMYGPKGILFCGYAAAEHQPLANALEQIGFGERPVIFVTDSDADKRLKEVLAYENHSGMGQPSTMARATIMSGFTQQEAHLLMNAYRQAGLPQQLWATVTPASEDWTVAALLKELAAEAEAFRKKQSGQKSTPESRETVTDKEPSKKSRTTDPYMDRRSGEDRRQVYDSNYFAAGGKERRSYKERRQQKERRSDCIPTGEWTSVCPDDDEDNK